MAALHPLLGVAVGGVTQFFLHPRYIFRDDGYF
jgi:hypothetical protein